MKATVELQFPSLPLWRGLQDQPGKYDAFPFSLGWDKRGFVTQTTPAEIRGQIVAAYARPDYQFITPPPGKSAWANRLGDTKLNRLQDMLGSMNGKRVIEIGAGTTYVAENLLKKHSITEYQIIDPSIQFPSQAISSLKLIKEYFPSPLIDNQKFDIVIGFSCLEHVEDPGAFLLAVRDTLSGPQARALLQFPDMGRAFHQGDLNALVHEHLSYFDQDAVYRLCEWAGLRVCSLESSNDLFTLVACMDPDGPRHQDHPPGGLLSAAVSIFPKRLQAIAHELRAALGQGQSIAFYGANNGLNSLFHTLSDQSLQGCAIFDGDDSKVGRFLPAISVPVQHSSALAQKKFDRIFISAASFYDEIKQSLMGSLGQSPQSIHPIFCNDGHVLEA